MRDIDLENRIVFSLSGSSHERRKKYRKILRAYPNACIEKRSSRVCYKEINGKRVRVEDANSIQTSVVVHYNLGSVDKTVRRFAKAKISILYGKPLLPLLISGKPLCN